MPHPLLHKDNIQETRATSKMHGIIFMKQNKASKPAAQLKIRFVTAIMRDFLSRCRSAETQCWVRIRLSVCPHSWSACATDLLTSNVHVAAPYCARQLKTQTRFQQERLKQQEVGLQGIRKNDRLRSAENVDYTS